MNNYSWNKRDCHLCQKETPFNDMTTIRIDYEYFGVNGFKHELVCKECYRDDQLDELFKSENTEERIRCSQ